MRCDRCFSVIVGHCDWFRWQRRTSSAKVLNGREKMMVRHSMRKEDDDSGQRTDQMKEKNRATKRQEFVASSIT